MEKKALQLASVASILVFTTVLGAVAGVAEYKIVRLNRKRIREETSENKRVLILVNHEVVIYNFRLELVERLLADGYEVHISTPVGERIEKLRELGAIIHPISFDRHGMNPIDELSIIREYMMLMKEIKPLIVFGYTIKPNLYGAIACRMYGIPFVSNITGLGTAVENGGIKQKLTVLMYRFSFGTKKGKIQRVFFQNEENEKFFTDEGIALDVHSILPGSGVNLERFKEYPLPQCGDGKEGEPVKFAFISRIMIEKGIEQYLDAAEAIKKDYPNTEFHVCGFFEPEYDKRRLERLADVGTIIFHGNIEDVGTFMSSVHCIIHPTYYAEGLSNVLLEASATGRPIITCDRAGCREVVEANGFLFSEQSSEELIDVIKQFIDLNNEQKHAMGKAGRKLVEKKFSRQIIIDAYMDEVRSANNAGY